MQKSAKLPRLAIIPTVIAVIFAFGFSSHASAAKKTVAQHWAETNVNFTLIAKLVTTEKCSKSALVQPCISALSAIAMQAIDPATLVTDSQILGQPYAYTTVLKDFGILKVVLNAKPDEISGAAHPIVHVRAATRFATVSAKAIVESGIASKINWDSIFSFVVQLPRVPNTAAFAAGAALNAYYGALLDPNTHFSPSAMMTARVSSADESFGGIGSDLQAIGGHIILAEPYEDSPSLKAGLFSDDELLEVDGTPVLGQAIASVIDRIRGLKGTAVTIKIKRAGVNDPLEFKIVRQTVVSKGVESKLISAGNRKFGFIKLKSFMPRNSCDAVAAAISDAQRAGASGLILDLRNNGGGLLDQGVCIGALFIGDDHIVVQVKDLLAEDAQMQRSTKVTFAKALTNGGYQIFERQDKDLIAFPPVRAAHIIRFPLTTLPTVVLTNAGSASSSEVVAGALQDWAAIKNLPIWIAGDRSFGKATAQSITERLTEIAPELARVTGLSLSKTIQRLYQPTGRSNQIVGIMPDFPIPPKPDATADDREALREEDLYTNALPAVGAPWTEPRPQQVAQIAECASGGEAQSKYAAAQGAQIRPDYRLLVATDLLGCIVNQLPNASTPLRIR